MSDTHDKNGGAKVINFAAYRNSPSLAEKSFVTTSGRQSFKPKQRIAIELEGEFKAATISKVHENTLTIRFNDRPHDGEAAPEMTIYPAQHKIIKVGGISYSH